MSYDRWLEAPYDRAAQKDAMFENFCEERGFEYDDPSAEAAFEVWVEELEEERELSMAEARAERRVEERDD